MARRRSNNDDREIIGSGEFRGSRRMGTAVISGATFTNKAVTYYDVNGVAIIEGDIAIGMVKDLERQQVAARDAVSANPLIAYSVAVTGSQFRWSDGVVPYEIDPALPNQHRIIDAIAHWESHTPLRFPLRTLANQGQYPNWIRFADMGGCWSFVGMQGGQQTISLDGDCGTGNAIHEIAHAIGLWHEQSREDRDLFVTIQWQNIKDGQAAQFHQHITDGDDLAAYDYNSIMHYPRDAWSKNGQDTIIPTNPAIVIGQRNSLSEGDIAEVWALYPTIGTSSIVAWFNQPQPFKKLRDDGVFDKIRDDEALKGAMDALGPILPSSPPKIPIDPLTQQRRPIRRSGTLQPFSLATPHHAVFGVPSTVGATESGEKANFDALERQIFDLEAAIVEALSHPTLKDADAVRMRRYRDALTKLHDAIRSEDIGN